MLREDNGIVEGGQAMGRLAGMRKVPEANVEQQLDTRVVFNAKRAIAELGDKLIKLGRRFDRSRAHQRLAEIPHFAETSRPTSHPEARRRINRR
jgi:hypothetical protein